LTEDGRARPARIEFRRRRFLSFLFSEVERRGGSVKPGKRHDFEITIAGEPLDVTVREPWRMRRDLTDDERRKAWAEGRRPNQDPTGTLQLRIESWFDAPIRKSWRDGKDNPLENQVRSILIGLFIAASFDRKRRLEREAEHRRSVLAQKRREAEEERRRKEKARIDGLMCETSAWEQAERIRRYIEARTRGSHDAKLRAWANWALEVADRLDPLAASGHESQND